MIIEVRKEYNTLFNGQADDFLFMQDNDIELENLLDNLDTMNYNSIIRFEDVEIEKLEYDLYD